MSNHEGNNKYTIDYQKLKNQQAAARNCHRKNAQVPRPEPRRKLLHSLVGGEPNSKDGLTMEDQNSAHLIRINQRNEAHNYSDDTAELRASTESSEPAHRKDHASQPEPQLHGVQAQYITDGGGVGSSTTHEANYGYGNDSEQTVCRNDAEDELADEYYENEENCGPSSQRIPGTNELASLSRQSMVPIHELIAYYQYIQNGDQHQPADRATGSSSATTSRQSSSASQLTTRTGHSDDDADNFHGSQVRSIRSKRSSGQPDIKLDDHDDSGSCLSRQRSSSKEDQSSPTIVVDVVETQDLDLLRPVEDEEQIAVAATTARDRSRLRANVVLELIHSERDFVKHLKDVVDGYLHRVRKHPEIFTGQRINTIFANIEQLYEFQREFLKDLEDCIVWDDLAESQVGHCFLKYQKGFSVYHYYCNNHPNATSELQELYTKPIFRAFFEECRLKQNMIDISLDGFLLTPIQKICKYPLQLTELLKNTEPTHPDYEPVSNALVSMRNCANLANERKRRIEALADVMSFQEKFDNWFGPKLSDTSSILVHSGEVSKMTSHTWSQGVQLFLFDHLLLYSKRDILKRNNLVLKGRICMDTITEISDADEYKPRKSFKLFCGEQQKWFVFTTKSEKEKNDWIRAFERERNLVETDENEGFQITDRELGIARRTLQHRKRSRSARYRHRRPDTAIVDQLEADDPNMIINRTLSLPSCIHPSHVMNFVEDSRVVPTNSGATCNRPKKSSSPISNSRSPVTSSQHLAEHPDNQSGPTNWLRKMGSKKLSKSQVYNINGQTGHNQPSSSTNVGSQQKNQPTLHNMNTSATNQQTTVAPSSHQNMSSLSDDAAAIKYEELEKRHRDHMFSEEQARLYRLNNDLPAPPTLYPRSVTPTHCNNLTPTSLQDHASNSSMLKTSPQPQQPRQRPYNQASSPYLVPISSTQSEANAGKRTPSDEPRQKQPISTGSISLDRRDDPTNLGSLSLGHPSSSSSSDQLAQTTATFETELVLSSGRVVRVREDAV